MKTKQIISVLLSLLFAMVVGLAFQPILGIHGLATGAVLFGLSFLPMPQGVMRAAVLREAYTKKVVEEISNAEKDNFLEGIEDFSSYVSKVSDESQAIHLAYMGVVPDVLVNNTTYPIPLQTLGDDDIVIQLDKYQTKPTPISDDELYAATYDKMGQVKKRHAAPLSAKR